MESLFLFLCTIFYDRQFLAYAYPLNNANYSLDVSTLRFVHAIWRHGDRTPTHSFPTAPPSWTWAEGPGELTKIGMRQQRQLGSYIRKRYIDSGFLSKEYNSTEIYIYSTDVNRTIMSALSNLAGMYPPVADSDSVFWQPIPVHTKPKMEDPMVWSEMPCPKTDEIFLNEIMPSSEVAQLKQENQQLIDLLQNYTGLKFNNSNWLDNMKGVYNELNCEVDHNRTWPFWVTPEIFARVESLAFDAYRLSSSDFRLYRLRGGLLYQEIANRFDQKAKQSRSVPKNLKYYAYSAHDTTIRVQLHAYGAYDGILPPYASALLYEMHERERGKFTIELFYVNDRGATEPTRITIKGCDGEICTLEKFVSLAKNQNITLAEYYKECAPKEVAQPRAADD